MPCGKRGPCVSPLSGSRCQPRPRSRRPWWPSSGSVQGGCWPITSPAVLRPSAWSDLASAAARLAASFPCRPTSDGGTLTRTQRASLLALAAAALVVAFILLRPDADPDQPAPPTTSEPTPAPGADSTSAKAPAEPPRKPASGPLLVAGKVQ